MNVLMLGSSRKPCASAIRRTSPTAPIGMAHSRLNQPSDDKVNNESFVLANSAAPAGPTGPTALSDQQARPDVIGHFAGAEPKVQAPKIPSPQELAQIDLPLPSMSSDAGVPKSSARIASAHELASIGLPLPSMRANSAGGRRAFVTLSLRERAHSDLPPMAGNPLDMKGPALSVRPSVSRTAHRIGRQETGRPIAFHAKLDLPDTNFVSPARIPRAKVSAAPSLARPIASTRGASSIAAAPAAKPDDQAFSAAFAENTGNIAIPEPTFGQQGELLLVQPAGSKSAPEAVASVGDTLSSAPGADQTAANRFSAPAQPVLHLPLPAPDTDSSPPKL